MPFLIEQIGKKCPEETVIFYNEDVPHGRNSLVAGNETGAIIELD